MPSQPEPRQGRDGEPPCGRDPTSHVFFIHVGADREEPHRLDCTGPSGWSKWLATDRSRSQRERHVLARPGVIAAPLRGRGSLRQSWLIDRLIGGGDWKSTAHPSRVSSRAPGCSREFGLVRHRQNVNCSGRVGSPSFGAVRSFSASKLAMPVRSRSPAPHSLRRSPGCERPPQSPSVSRACRRSDPSATRNGDRLARRRGAATARRRGAGTARRHVRVEHSRPGTIANPTVAREDPP